MKKLWLKFEKICKNKLDGDHFLVTWLDVCLESFQNFSLMFLFSYSVKAQRKRVK